MPDARVRTPKPVPEQRDLRGAPLTSTDGFILSRVDGTLDELEIVGLSGLPDEVVLMSLRKLESLGLITFDGARLPPTRTPEVVPSVGQTARSFQPAAHRQAEQSRHSTGPNGGPDALTPEENGILSEEVDLEPDLRRQILLLYRDLQHADHYAMLQVERTSDRKSLKRAYFDLAAKFHPDRYFRKNLGSFKLRMEAIFRRITLAHDALTDKERRAEYDAYLEEQRRSRGIEDLLADALAEARRAEERIEIELREQENVAGGFTSPAPPRQSQPIAPANPTAAPANSAAGAAVRREALARRLLGGRAQSHPSVPSGPSAPSKPPVSSASDAVAALRRRYEERVAGAKASQARKYASNAQAALAARDPVAAANAYRVALTLSPHDPDLVRMAQAAQQQADAILSETYGRQAGYEEKNGQWAEASRSWARVIKARPKDAAAHDHAANALIKADGDLHEAARIAQVACTIEPANSAFRVTLASVYLAAGLALNARRELETAAQLAPHDDTIQAMLQRLGKS